MDDFGQELSRIMHETQENTPFGEGQRSRLQAGVRVRRRTRWVGMAIGSALTVAGLGIGTVTLSSAFAQDAPATAAHSGQPSLIKALQHDIPANLGHLRPDMRPGSFVLVSPRGTKTNLRVLMHLESSPRARTAFTCETVRAKQGASDRVNDCADFNVAGGSGRMMSGTEAGLKYNAVEYARPYKGAWLMVDVESCNALHACETGWVRTPPRSTPRPPCLR